ncbi:MAG TPA: helix-turn-helix domain-containing protein [Burkholderiales bacterium]|jgi:hypothetical protein|nr:helix-turn-helix domain-containing protein [Burkholderiales bacterium]
MEERLRFVAKLLEGESMSEVCREFGISRKTGYKIFARYREHGFEALSDRSRRPVRYANQLPPQIESLIVKLKQEKPHWGARKISRAPGSRPRPGLPSPGQEHDPRRFASAWPGQGDPPPALTSQRHWAFAWGSAQRPVVRRLQGRVQAWQRPVLLPPDGH